MDKGGGCSNGDDGGDGDGGQTDSHTNLPSV
jgi:hypothetical protein